MALALVLGLSLSPIQEAWAQDDGGGGGHRKWLYALIGAAVAGVPAYVFNNGRSIGSNCSGDTCVTIVASALGGGAGWLIGSELDAKAARRRAAGPSLDYDFRNVSLGLVPDRMSGFPGGAAVIGLGGARVVMHDGTIYQRGVGVRGIEDATVMPMLDLLVLSTTGNLLAFPVRGEDAQGQVIDERGGGTMEVFQQNLAVAGLDSLRMLKLEQGDGEITIETLAQLEQLDFVTDMAFSHYSRVGWVLVDDRLVGYSAELEKLGELVLPAAGRSVRERGGQLAVAAGTSGAYVVDARDPSAPEVVRHFTGVRFSYAADLGRGDLLFVAAGPEGLAVVDIREDPPVVIGVAREVDMATDVNVAEDGSVWILDRDGQRVQIARFARDDDRIGRSSSGER